MKRFTLRAVVVALLWSPFFAQAQAPGGAQAQAQGPARVGERYGDWVFECVAIAEGRTACALTHAIVSRGDNRQIGQMSLGRNERKGGAVVLTAFLPLGLHIPAGVSGTIDQGKPFQFTLETCLPRRGCIATYVVSAEVLKLLQGGQQLSIGMSAGDGPKPVSLGVPLRGLADGLRAAKLN